MWEVFTERVKIPFFNDVSIRDPCGHLLAVAPTKLGFISDLFPVQDSLQFYCK